MRKNCLNVMNVGDATVALVRGRVIKNSIRTGKSASGVSYAHFAVSVSECDRAFEYLCKKLDAKTDMKNEYNGKTSYVVRMTAFRYNADFVANYISNDQPVMVQCLGEVTKDSYNGKDNLNMTVQAVEIADDNSYKSQTENTEQAQNATFEQQPQEQESVDIDLSEIDF